MLNEDHGLTPEEEAALALPDDPTEGAQNVDPDTDPEAAAQPEAGANEAKDAQAATAPDAVAAAEPAAVAANAEPEAAPAAAPAPAKLEAAPAPLLIVQAPEDAQAKLTQIAADKTALMDRFEAGEITTKEYQSGLDTLNDQAFDLKSQVREADLARKLGEQQIQNQWVADCTTFLAEHREYAAGSERRDLLDEIIKSFVHRPSMQNVANHVALEKAHRMVLAELGDATPAAAAPAAGKTVVQHKVPTPAAPPNIGALPAAAMNDTTGGEFAAIESLRKSGDVDGYESALEKMSEAARARYFKA